MLMVHHPLLLQLVVLLLAQQLCWLQVQPLQAQLAQEPALLPAAAQ
jgi:hypothetical protein